MKKSVSLILLFVVLLSFAYAEEAEEIEMIPYESLIRYAELFDPDLGINKVIWGRVPVRIETVIGDVIDGADGEYTFDMWIKGEKCYYYVKQIIDKWSHDLSAFPEKPSYPVCQRRCCKQIITEAFLKESRNAFTGAAVRFMPDRGPLFMKNTDFHGKRTFRQKTFSDWTDHAHCSFSTKP